eukprot:CAMPEP_0114450284 /NCGR_PEP_ID=MMETSP0104-20121206/378_1 /TAXON_ID=37642 ORGANISM="Paraphysomonas imperforata, Strain PA2" /NCGR_SAMPLE_ID=MMETSP0104 /ASSEMBLY_ACC=CAM_ASM_000202 /LENGTH=281 /DNA_ID=CAMNT_0001622415 /DNA_START=323 /DNA_END=1168 /DNA_ORIENTATION=-
MQFLFLTETVVVGLVLIPLLYVLLEWCAFEISSSTSYLHTSVVGYSGILFLYAVVDAFHETSSRLFCGVEIPSYLYPFLLLFLLQILVPEVSFVGHASGVLVGLFVVYGFCACFFPSQATIASKFENPNCFLYEWINHSSYVQVNSNQPDGFVIAPAGMDSSQVVRRHEWLSCCGYITALGGLCQEKLYALRQWVGERTRFSRSTPNTHEYGTLPSTSLDASYNLEEGSSVAPPVPVLNITGGSNSHGTCSTDSVTLGTSQSRELTNDDIKAIRIAKFQKS